MAKKTSQDIDSRKPSSALLYAGFFFALFVFHIPLLRLPYFWDEAGYYIPAARDLFLSGALIPYSTVSNAHPPLVMAWLALAWKLLGYSPLVTRTAMLLVAAFALLGVFRLAQRVANKEVAWASTICTALYPVFFAQSSLAHVDLAAAGLTFWGLYSYVKNRQEDGPRWHTAFWFSLAVLAKETAILAPLALFAWEIVERMVRAKALAPEETPRQRAQFIPLLLPLFPLALWYAYHYLRTGFVFGNAEFFRYNVQATLSPLRIVLALGMRIWQIAGYMGLYALTLATLFAMQLPALRDSCAEGNEQERRRIPLDLQLVFVAVITAYVLAMAVVGGAVLARYMLPAVPLVIIIGVSTLRRRVRWWRRVVAIVVVAFVASLFVNPPYGFAPEDNLAYRDYVLLHLGAEDFIQARYPMARVLTAWPASDELTRPYLGYTTRPMHVVRIEDFTVDQLFLAADLRSHYDVALVFSTKYEPPHPWFERWRTWQEWKSRFFGFHRDVPPEAAAQLLGGRLVYSQRRQGQWVGVIEMERVEDAELKPNPVELQPR